MKIRKKNLVHENFSFEYSYHPGRSFRFEFQCNSPSPNRFFPSADREVAGFFEIGKDVSKLFRIQFLLAPCDMISDSRELEHIAYIESLNANVLEIGAKSGNLSFRHFLHICPEEISEEGWFFDFTEATETTIGIEKNPVTAEYILSDILIGDSIKFSVCHFQQAKQETFDLTKFSGVATHFASVQFPFLDEFRSVFSDTFGQEALNELLARKGYELDK